MTQSQHENPDTTPASAASSEALSRVLALVRFLRANCPWDGAQTPRSLLPYMIEEAHEVADAVQDGDEAELTSELGDLLLHVAFQVVLAEERGAFDAGAVADAVELKMRRRHPHLYPDSAGSATAPAPPGTTGSSEQWEALKARERPDRSLVDGLPRGLDPLSLAHRLQERVSAVGFDWPDPSGALAKVREEVDEVTEALDSGDATRLEEELGDLLFSVVNLTRLAGSHGMHALGAANRKFGERFRALESLAADRGVDLGAASLEEMDALWDEVKRGG